MSADAHEVAAAPGQPDHDHDRRLVAVHLEDGSTTREHACSHCGAVWFS